MYPFVKKMECIYMQSPYLFDGLYRLPRLKMTQTFGHIKVGLIIASLLAFNHHIHHYVGFPMQQLCIGENKDADQ